MPITQAQIDALKAIDAQRATLINGLVADGVTPPAPPAVTDLHDPAKWYPPFSSESGAHGEGNYPPGFMFQGNADFATMEAREDCGYNLRDNHDGTVSEWTNSGKVPNGVDSTGTRTPRFNVTGTPNPNKNDGAHTFAQLQDAATAGTPVGQTPPPATPPPAGGTNVALASNGGTTSASSVVNPAYPTPAVNDGDRKGLHWGSGGGWNSAQNPSVANPDLLQVNFSGQKSISRVDVYTVQDRYDGPIDPTDAMTFTQYGVQDFTLQGWNGSAWQTLGAVTSNNKVKVPISFPAFSTDRIRLVITKAAGGYSRVVEVEAY